MARIERINACCAVCSGLALALVRIEKANVTISLCEKDLRSIASMFDEMVSELDAAEAPQPMEPKE